MLQEPTGGVCSRKSKTADIDYVMPSEREQARSAAAGAKNSGRREAQRRDDRIPQQREEEKKIGGEGTLAHWTQVKGISRGTVKVRNADVNSTSASTTRLYKREKARSAAPTRKLRWTSSVGRRGGAASG